MKDGVQLVQFENSVDLHVEANFRGNLSFQNPENSDPARNFAEEKLLVCTISSLICQQSPDKTKN